MRVTLKLQKCDIPQHLLRFFRPIGHKPKDLINIPSLVAEALREHGWYLRSDIAWIKQASMPESVQDRPSSAWEHVWMLAKQPRYYYDALAVRQDSDPRQEAHNRRYAKPYATFDDHSDGRQPGNENHKGIHRRPGPGGASLRNWWLLGPEPASYDYCVACDTYYQGGARRRIRVVTETAADGSERIRRVCSVCGRDDAWVNHYAAFPRELVRRCLLASTSERGACVTCGAPWERVTQPSERYARYLGRGFTDHSGDETGGYVQQTKGLGSTKRHEMLTEMTSAERLSLGWRPTCSCYGPLPPVPVRRQPADQDGDVEAAEREYREAWARFREATESLPTRPCLTLDPFVGSGTTLLVARELGLRGVGVDASASYLALAARRLETVPLHLPLGAGKYAEEAGE